MLALFLAIGAIIIALCLLIWFAEIQITISLVINRGGIWAAYETAIARYRVVGFWIRLMPGHFPRAWMRVPYTSRHRKVDYEETIRSIIEPKWKPLQLPIKSVLGIGAKLAIKELNLSAKIGIEDDAVATALLCSSAGAAAHALRAAATRGKYMPKGRIVITPSFARNRFMLCLKCIVGIKARHIIREIAKSLLRRKDDGQSSD